MCLERKRVPPADLGICPRPPPWNTPLPGINHISNTRYIGENLCESPTEGNILGKTAQYTPIEGDTLSAIA
ncbi:uncharacterized protein PWA37_000865 [Arxiozyma heterogenica]|uniref:uncharacterized protein n=1 Tax=Arxiozyma heterogenica TaxID=278026 RepID=UPI002F0BD554